MKKTPRTCVNGHQYYKSSSCPVCPICEKDNNPGGWRSELSAPARRALQPQKITTLKELSAHTESTVLSLHGMGPSAMLKLRNALLKAGLSFKKE